MPEYAQTLTYLFAVAVVLLEVLIGMVFVSRVATCAWLPKRSSVFVERYGLQVAAVFAAGGVILSLWYSEIVGLPVCTLCWFARTMMYPLAVILIVSVLRKESYVRPYALALSTIGMLITGYHHMYQMGFVEGTLCTALSGGGDCAQRYVFEFGFVTMPLMGFTLFAAVTLLLWLSRGSDRVMID